MNLRILNALTVPYDIEPIALRFRHPALSTRKAQRRVSGALCALESRFATNAQ